MKGEIFNLLEQFIIQNSSAETYEEIYNALIPVLHTREPFVGPGTYRDEDFLAMIMLGCEKLGLPVNDVCYAFGKFSFAKLFAHLPDVSHQLLNIRSLLAGIDSIIHVEVRKLYPDAETPQFIFTELTPRKFSLVYRSKRRLIHFVRGMLQGAATYFSVPISLEMSQLNADDFEFIISIEHSVNEEAPL